MNRREIYRIYYRIGKTRLAQVVRGATPGRRTAQGVGEEYANVWQRSPASALVGRSVRPQLLGRRLVLCRSLDHRKFFLEHLGRVAASLEPRRALELGSGNGINVLALAVLQPSLEFLRGIELTPEGVKAARSLRDQPPIPVLRYLTGQTEAVIQKRIAGCDIDFVQGDMTQPLPWRAGEFDFVFSCWAFEQIPRGYSAAFREVLRVLRGYALFLEAFREAQANLFQRMHLANLDYFRAPIRVAEEAGFKILKFEPMALTKIKFTTGSLLCATPSAPLV